MCDMTQWGAGGQLRAAVAEIQVLCWAYASMIEVFVCGVHVDNTQINLNKQKLGEP